MTVKTSMTHIVWFSQIRYKAYNFVQQFLAFALFFPQKVLGYKAQTPCSQTLNNLFFQSPIKVSVYFLS